MVTLFDAAIPILILLAMALSHQPKQTAIAICLIASASITYADYMIAGTPQFYVFIAIEIVAFWTLLGFTRLLKEQKDRNYFRLMALMLSFSLIGTWLYLYDWVAFSTYLVMWKSVAVLHVAIMLGLSNGIELLGNRFADMYRAWNNRAVH